MNITSISYVKAPEYLQDQKNSHEDGPYYFMFCTIDGDLYQSNLLSAKTISNIWVKNKAMNPEIQLSKVDKSFFKFN